MNELLHQIIIDILYVGLLLYIISYANLLHNCYKWYVRYMYMENTMSKKAYKLLYDHYIKRFNVHNKLIIILFIIILIFKHYV